jgi:hypothetical protein
MRAEAEHRLRLRPAYKAPMKRNRSLLTATLLSVALALPAALSAQDLFQSATINGFTLGPLTAILVRADAPLPHTGTTDPSLANVFNFVTPTGINLNGVGNFIVPDPTDPRFIFSCTASRIGLRTIITAAHCITDDQNGSLLSTSGQSFARFLAPGSTNASPVYYTTPRPLNVVVSPSWHGFNNGSTYLARDLAVVNFTVDLPSFITTYGLFTANPLGRSATLAGYGTYGGGTGATSFDFGRRWGTNTVDYLPTDNTFSDYLDLYTDFDDPAGQYDTFCALGIACNTTYSFQEGSTAEGDSGGPLFINGLLAGVTSFGTYVCATINPCVPFAADQNRPFDSYGSLHGFAPIFANTQFIAVATVPEPSTVAMMAMGLLLAAAFVPKRRSR